MRKYLGGMLALVMTLTFALANVAMAGDAANGEKIFNDKKKKCKTCHNISEKKKVGPGLAGVSKRHSDGWMTKWLADPQGMWKANDEETAEMKKWPERYGKKSRAGKKKTKMKLKPPLTEAEIADLVAYMKTI
jgi:cytochrome c2